MTTDRQRRRRVERMAQSAVADCGGDLRRAVRLVAQRHWLADWNGRRLADFVEARANRAHAELLADVLVILRQRFRSAPCSYCGGRHEPLPGVEPCPVAYADHGRAIWSTTPSSQS